MKPIWVCEDCGKTYDRDHNQWRTVSKYIVREAEKKEADAEFVFCENCAAVRERQLQKFLEFWAEREKTTVTPN